MADISENSMSYSPKISETRQKFNVKAANSEPNTSPYPIVVPVTVEESQQILGTRAISGNETITPIVTTPLRLFKGEILYNTTAAWNAERDRIGERGTIYVYTDYRLDEESSLYIPGLKLGDGTSYLIDLPFIDATLTEHINDTSVHITEEERAFWNSKVRCYYSSIIDDETIIFTTN